MHPLAASSIDVSVLVPVFNESASIREAVCVMIRQEFDGTIEFLFADGRSTDDTKAQLERLASLDPRIRVLDNPRRGTASGLNVCLGAAHGTYVARMDAHTLYPSHYLKDGVNRLRRGGVAWVAGPQIPEPRGRVGAAVAAALRTRLGQGASRRWSHGDGGAHEYALDTGVFCGVWRREDLLAHSGWDEGWPRNQDSELAARFLDAGQRIVCVSTMGARYIPRDSLMALWRQYRGYGRYRAKTARRHPGSLRRSGVLPPLLVIDALVALAAPRALSRMARLGLLIYGTTLAAATAETARRSRSSAALVPVVLATMHIAHGVGFLEGAYRWGTPWRALWRIVGGGGDGAPHGDSIQAPSLRADGERR
jgi:succinoglycan biosynthesis protein ExoA